MIITRFKNDLLLACLLGLFSSFMTFAMSLIAAYLFSHHDNIEQHTVLLLSFFIFIISSSILNYLNEMQHKAINLKVLTFKMPLVWQHTLSLPLSKLTQFTSAQLCQMLRDHESSLAVLASSLLSALSSILLLLLLFGFLFYCHISLAILYACICLLLIGVKIIIYPYFNKLTSDHLTTQANAASFLNECLAQIHKIKTMNTEIFIHKKWLNLSLISKKMLAQMITIETAIWLIEAVTFAILMLITLYSHVSVSFLVCATQFILTYEKFSQELLSLVNLRVSLQQLSPIINASAEASSPAPSATDCNGELRLTNVSFNKLEKISMHISAGSFVALTGETGAGKSTIFRLILGLEPAYNGTILIDNQNIRDLNMQTVRKHFGVVLQTSSLFPGTLFSNLCANTNITLDESWRLARLVGLDDEINAMPMKMFTYISDTPGDSISGGQRQKILIARALASKPGILLLDEATSALDTASQEHVFKNLRLLNMTLFVIAHRLSTIKAADRVYRLDNGRVIMMSKDEFRG